jgi:hypothetical protein
VQINGSEYAGLDRFHVNVLAEAGPVIIIPLPKLRVAALSDLDADGDVDAADYADFMSCLAGPGTATGAGCEDADVDRDGDADLHDVAKFQNAYTNSACRALEIVEQPQRVDLCVGDRLELTVGVSADPPPRYLWFRNGIPIPGATEPTFVIDAVDENDWGFYRVEITNTCGTINSDLAAVRVIPSGIGPCP